MNINADVVILDMNTPGVNSELLRLAQEIIDALIVLKAQQLPMEQGYFLLSLHCNCHK